MQVAELFQPLVDSPILLLLAINVFLFLAGMVMDLTPNVLIFAPVFYPLIQQAGIYRDFVSERTESSRWTL